MTTPRLLLPLRVPELGPHLGLLVTGTGRIPGGLRLDGVREHMVTRLIESSGEARRLAARDERDATLAVLGRDTWLSAWDEAVHQTTDLLVDRVTRRLEAEARAVRMPARRRPHIDERARRGIAARLGSSGGGLISAVDALEERSVVAVRATALERGDMERWQEALTACARRLEAAWLALEDAVEREAAGWDGVGTAISRWRRPIWPVVAVGVALVAVVAALGLVLGGYVTAPGWLRRVWSAVGLR
jgi:hypothetical protein